MPKAPCSTQHVIVFSPLRYKKDITFKSKRFILCSSVHYSQVKVKDTTFLHNNSGKLKLQMYLHTQIITIICYIKY